MDAAYALSDTEPEPFGSHDELTARYHRHVAAIEHSMGNLRAWHIAAARGLYRLLADIELDGGPAAPMGMPHLLCISDKECRALVSAERLNDQPRERKEAQRDPLS